MADSLLAHLYSRIKGSQEDVATLSLQYLLSKSSSLNHAFTDLIASSLRITLPRELEYICQVTGEDRDRPDMAGLHNGQELVLCEMKFYAGLTQNQPIAYLDRLRKHAGYGLIFICPTTRKYSLLATLKQACSAYSVSDISDFCFLVDGMPLAILTWKEVTSTLRKTASVSDPALLADIHQLEGFCSQIDVDAFIPFTPEELTAENAHRADRYYEVIDNTIDLLCADKSLKTSKKGLKATAYRKGYERCLYLNEFTIALNHDRDLWKNKSTMETPFWLSIRENWKETARIHNALQKIDSFKRDNSIWNITFIALTVPPHAALDEICKSLKQQILGYIDIFHNTN